MIDYIALSIGHFLLAIALLRLVMRDGLDVDPLLARFKEREEERRKATKAAGRASRRRAQTHSQSHSQAQSQSEPGAEAHPLEAASPRPGDRLS